MHPTPHTFCIQQPRRTSIGIRPMIIEQSQPWQNQDMSDWGPPPVFSLLKFAFTHHRLRTELARASWRVMSEGILHWTSNNYDDLPVSLKEEFQYLTTNAYESKTRLGQNFAVMVFVWIGWIKGRGILWAVLIQFYAKYTSKVLS